MKILIAGASGFIGRALIERLLRSENESLEIIALSRQERKSTDSRLVWMKCDLFSMKDIQTAMSGCDVAYYLVHSMLPSADLSQGSFYDFDLILADNFARCAKSVGVRHLVYLGGMIPGQEELSWHLKSRLEVEEALRESGIPVTTLRAGLIIGQRGSSFRILRRLVERLPLMVCPAWTRTESQPIALSEILEVLEQVIQDASLQGRIYDVGGPEVLTYQKLILLTAEALGVKRRLYSFNLVPIRLSRLWVSLITGSSKDLVYPLVLSLKHRMVANPAQAWNRWIGPRVGMREALQRAIHGTELDSISEAGVGSESWIPAKPHDVRSIQRLHHPVGKTAEWVASEYFRWLETLFVFLIRVHVNGSRCTFSFLHKGLPLLILEKSEERSTPDRQLLYLKGGLLVSKKTGRGRLEFREALGGTVILAAIHEFVPALPWFVYRYTQAILHVWVMRLFERHLRTL